MQRDINSYPLSAELKTKLTSSGFHHKNDLLNLKPTELSRELCVSNEDALTIISTVFKEKNEGNSRHTRNALEILNEKTENIITFSEKLDNMLGGGVAVGKITEICGAPGTGKTQTCMQLCVDVQIPTCLGGLSSGAVYIDTEGSFVVQRLAQIATAAISYCQELLKQCDNVQEDSNLKLENVLKRIHYIRCHSYTELIATIHLLPNLLKKEKIKLVVIDSIAFPFRQDFSNYSLRTRLLNGIAQTLTTLAVSHSLAVVLTNQMTTKIKSDNRPLVNDNQQHNSSYLVPALGESWGHASTIRIILYWDKSKRHALLYKSPSMKECTVLFQITAGGVRDLDNNDFTDNLSSDNEQQLKKRQRIS